MFKLEKREWQWFLLLGGLIFLLTAAGTMLWCLLQAFVIKRAGASYIVYLFLMTSASAIIGSWFNIHVFRKWRALAQSMFFCFLALLCSLFLASLEHIFTAGFCIASLLFYAGFGALILGGMVTIAGDKLSVAATDVFDVKQMLRIQPLLKSVLTISMVATGMALMVFSAKIGSTLLFFSVPLFLLLAAPLYIILYREAKMDYLHIAEAEPLADGRGFKKYFPDKDLRNFLYFFGLIIGLSFAFGRIFNYQFSIAAAGRYNSETEINAFIGAYFAIFGISKLVFLNGLQRWLISKFGLIKNFFVPLFVVSASVIAVIFFPSFWTIIISVYLRDILQSVEQVSAEVMLQGVNDYQRNLAWSWLNGPIGSAGEIIGSLIVLAIIFIFGDGAYSAVRPVAAATLALLFLSGLAIFAVGKPYLSVILKNLAKGDDKTRLRAADILEELK